MRSNISFDDPLGKVIIIEGLPGIGKTTLLHEQYQLLRPQYPCRCYREETSQPLDLFRQAVLPKSLLNSQVELFLQKKPDCRTQLEQWLHHNSYMMGEYAIVAYTQGDVYNTPLYQFVSILKYYDLGDGKSSFEEYAYYHKLVWRNFAKKIYDPQKVYLSEGSLFHNQLFDLVGFYGLSDMQLCMYYKELLAEAEGINIRLVFIHANDPKSLLEQTCRLRVGWYTQLEQWLMYAPWAKERRLHGINGMLSLYNQIQRTHLMLQKELGLQVETLIRF